VRWGHRRGRAHEHRPPAAGARPDVRRPRRVRPRRRAPLRGRAARRPRDARRPLSLLPGLVPLTREEDGAIVAEVLWVDRYGNCQLNVDPDEVAPFGPRVQLRWADDVRTAERSTTYAGITPGQIGLVVDSYGLLSVCLGQRSAATDLRLTTGTEVILAAPADDAPPAAPVSLTTKARP
jgi:hypothetical protein